MRKDHADAAALGERHLERYMRCGDEKDFTLAERALRAALETPGLDLLDRSSVWIRLGLLYDSRFRLTGDRSARDRSVDALGAGRAEGSGNPLLAMSYVEVVVNRGRDATVPNTKRLDLDTALDVLATPT